MLLLLFCLCGLTGCGEDEPSSDDLIWDIYPAEIRIQLMDREGNNLLDPEFEGNLVGGPFRVLYNDSAYNTIWNEEEYYQNDFYPINTGTRAYMPIFHGLVWNGIWGDTYKGHYALVFGEFDGAKNQNIKITLLYEPVNTVFEIELRHTITWKNNSPVITNHIIYQNREIPGNNVVIVL